MLIPIYTEQSFHFPYAVLIVYYFGFISGWLPFRPESTGKDAEHLVVVAVTTVSVVDEEDG